jgi:hypothetical protein
MNPDIYISSLLVAGSLGFFLGLSELVNRYSSFEKIFKNLYSWIYMLINLVASISVYLIIKKYRLNLGSLGQQEIGIGIFSGLGAMAFLRSSFFNYKTSTGQVIAVGPAAILTVFLRAAEMEFDRIISDQHVSFIGGLMKDIPFVSASKDLPLIILASMRALNSEEQKNLSDDILKLVNDTTSTTEAKNIAMGTILIKYTGKKLLKTSVDALNQIYNSTVKESLNKISNLQLLLKEKIKGSEQ